MILIDRGLELHVLSHLFRCIPSLFGFLCALQKYRQGKARREPELKAPLAQLVEQLTLNQWVPGSNP